MKRYSDKYRLIASTDDVAEIQIGDSAIKKSNDQRLLGVKIDNKLSSNGHVKSLGKKSTNELNVLTRILPYMELKKKKENHPEFTFQSTV